MKQFLINTLIITKHAGAELVCGRLMGNYNNPIGVALFAAASQSLKPV